MRECVSDRRLAISIQILLPYTYINNKYCSLNIVFGATWRVAVAARESQQRNNARTRGDAALAPGMFRARGDAFWRTCLSENVDREPTGRGAEAASRAPGSARGGPMEP
jgi:hypothetical protein